MLRKKNENRGRKTVMTKDVIDKLEFAFSIGCSDNEACLYAGIERTTLHRYQKNNPNFCNRKELLKDSVVLKARQNVYQAIEVGDLDTSTWYLERKRKAEFSTRQETTGADGGPIQTTIDTSKLSDKAMEELLNATKDQLDE